MAQHGYLHEDYDEAFERGEGGDRNRDWRERDRDFMFVDGERGRNDFAAHRDAEYLAWRDRHMRELDRDYAEYRREREQQFHADFDSWRNRRHGTGQPLQAGMTQTSTAGDPTGTLELSGEMRSPTDTETDPTATATLGTTSSGRGRR